LKDVTRIILGDDQAKKLQGLSMSNDTIRRRINDISDDVEEQILNAVRESPYFAIATDESTDVASLSQLMVWVKFLKDDDFLAEPLFCSPLELTTTGRDVFTMLDSYFKTNDISWSKLIGSWRRQCSGAIQGSKQESRKSPLMLHYCTA
jgi:hypothetical protein